MSEAERSPPVGNLPGDEGVWYFISADLLLFTLLFGVFGYARIEEPALFAEAQAELFTVLAAMNTVVLLTSSLFAALAIHNLRKGHSLSAQRQLVVTIMLGAVFIFIKVFEYYADFTEGITPAKNQFFMYYFVITGMHMLHVLVALTALLATLLFLRAKPVVDTFGLRVAESTVLFWHVVDLLWLLIVPYIYLAR